MTSQAIDRFMSAAGRKFCEIVIKTVAPGDCVQPVARNTIGRESRRPVVDRRRVVEILAVTRKTIGLSLGKPERDVTLFALRQLVFPFQRERSLRMIEFHRCRDFGP